MGFTPEELASMAAWDEAVMEEDLTEEEIAASTVRDAWAAIERDMALNKAINPHTGRVAEREPTYGELYEKSLEKKRKAHEYYEARKAKGTQETYDYDIYRKSYLKNRQKRLDYQREQHKKDQYRRTHPAPEDVNAYCGYCGKPLYVKPYQMKKTKSGKHFCGYNCKVTFYKELGITKWKEQNPENENAEPEQQGPVEVTHSLYTHVKRA